MKLAAQGRDVIRVEDSAVPDGEDHEPAQTILKAPLPNARPRARKEVLVPGMPDRLSALIRRSSSHSPGHGPGCDYNRVNTPTPPKLPDALVWPAVAVVNQLRRLG